MKRRNFLGLIGLGAVAPMIVAKGFIKPSKARRYYESGYQKPVTVNYSDKISLGRLVSFDDGTIYTIIQVDHNDNGTSDIFLDRPLELAVFSDTINFHHNPFVCTFDYGKELSGTRVTLDMVVGQAYFDPDSLVMDVA